MSGPQGSIELSLVAPAHNERENLRPLVEEVAAVLDGAALDYEIILVNDGSTDGSDDELVRLQAEFPRLRVLRMMDTPPGRGLGQSAALAAGMRVCRGELIAMMDADLQNDPADLPRMLALMREQGADLVQGDRTASRQDSLVRRVSSLVGRLFRRWLLGDTIRDTGCSLRLMRREIAAGLPLEFRGMHRFIPVTARQLGYTVIEMPVKHRARTAGETKYGIWNRALPGLVDCLGVRWMSNRRRPVRAVEPVAERKPEPVSALSETTR